VAKNAYSSPGFLFKQTTVNIMKLLIQNDNRRSLHIKLITAEHPGVSVYKLNVTKERNSGYVMMPHMQRAYTHHEGTHGYWRYSSTHSSPWYSTEVTGQPHAPAASPTEKIPRHQFNYYTQCSMERTHVTTQWRMERHSVHHVFLQYRFEWQWQKQKKNKSVSNENFDILTTSWKKSSLYS
jgi:hypothetical protein